MQTSPSRLVRALVVDDDAMTRRLMERILVRLGCEVLAADGAHSGGKMLGASDIDIVFTDVIMPDSEAGEAVNHYRTAASSRNNGRPLTVVAVSGRALGSNRQDYLDAGYDDYIEKPISPVVFQSFFSRWSTASD